MRSIFILSLMSLLVRCGIPTSNSNTESEQPTTIYFVRHAEQIVNEQEDPVLNSKGKDRAQNLKYFFENQHLDVVLSTPFIRAVKTVQPTAESKKIKVDKYNPDEDLKVFIDEVLSLHKGKTILIVGHKTTIPGMLNVLCECDKYPDFIKAQHSDLYQAVLMGNELLNIQHLKNDSFNF